MKTYERLQLLIVDNRGERKELLITDEHLEAGDIIDRVAKFMGAVTDPDEWEKKKESSLIEKAELEKKNQETMTAYEIKEQMANEEDEIKTDKVEPTPEETQILSQNPQSPIDSSDDEDAHQTA